MAIHYAQNIHDTETMKYSACGKPRCTTNSATNNIEGVTCKLCLKEEYKKQYIYWIKQARLTIEEDKVEHLAISHDFDIGNKLCKLGYTSKQIQKLDAASIYF